MGPGMNAKHYKVLFEGKIQPGHEQESVKKSLAALFKADETRINRLFSGKPYAVSRDLSEKSARKYEKAILKAGGICRIVSMNGDQELKPAQTATHSGNSPDSLRADLSQRITAPPKSFCLRRRIGRCQYISLCWLVLFIEAIAFLLPDYLPRLIGATLTIQQTTSITLGLHGLAIAIAVWAMVTRLHDMNRSGILWLFIIVPVINLMLMTWLTLGTGTRGSNAFGNQPASPGNLARLLGVYIPVGLVMTGAGGGWLYQDELLKLVQELPATLSEEAGRYFPIQKYLPNVS